MTGLALAILVAEAFRAEFDYRIDWEVARELAHGWMRDNELI